MSQLITTRERNIRLKIAREQIEREKNRLEELTSRPHETLSLTEASEVVYLLSKELDSVGKELAAKKKRAKALVDAYYDAAPEIESIKEFFGYEKSE